jgi:hypothetical protein
MPPYYAKYFSLGILKYQVVVLNPTKSRNSCYHVKMVEDIETVLHACACDGYELIHEELYGSHVGNKNLHRCMEKLIEV